MLSGECCITNYTKKLQGKRANMVRDKVAPTVYSIIDSRKDITDYKGQGHGEWPNNGEVCSRPSEIRIFWIEHKQEKLSLWTQRWEEEANSILLDFI